MNAPRRRGNAARGLRGGADDEQRQGCDRLDRERQDASREARGRLAPEQQESDFQPAQQQSVKAEGHPVREKDHQREDHTDRRRKRQASTQQKPGRRAPEDQAKA